MSGEAQKVSYSLRVVEILPEQTLQDALQKNPAALERKNLTETSFQVPGKGGLASEKIYAVSVTAFGPGGIELSRSSGSVFGFGWTINFCFLIPISPVDYCIGQSSGLNVAWAFMTGSGSFSWTLTPVNPAGPQLTGSSTPITILANQLPGTQGTYTYNLVATKGTCSRSTTITINAHQAPTAGSASISAALHFTDAPSWTQFVNICCGTGLKLQVAPPIVGNIQWEQSTNNGITWTPVSGATGNPININSQQLPPCPAQPKGICYHARISTGAPCADFVTNTVYAVIYPPPQGTVTAVPSAICVGSPVTITLSGNQPGTTWTWTPTLSQAPANTVSFTDVPAATTTYQATVKWPVVMSPSGTCQPVTPGVTVTVDQKPVAGTLIASPPIICPGDDSVLTLTGSSGVAQWYSSTNPNPATFFTPANQIAGALGNTTQNSNILNVTTYFGVQVSSPNGVCPAVYSAIIPVTVNQPPNAPNITGSSHFICIGGSVTLTAPPLPTGLTYQWYCNGAPCGILNSQTLLVTDPGNYWVEIGWSALNPNGSPKACGTVKSNIWTIQADLLAVNIAGPCCPCKGQKIQLCAQPINGTGPYHYQWSANAGSSTAQCTLVIPTVTTTYTVTVTDNNGCHATTSFIVTVCP